MSCKIYILCGLLAMFSLTACVQDEDYVQGRGTLRIALDGVSTSVSTRSTPSELGAPVSTDFDISVTDAAGKEFYHRKYTSEDIPLPFGEYTVTATYGDNPVLALDNPYYCGTTTAAVEPDKVTTADLTCRVGNALISVTFGRDVEEQERFNRFYSSYALDVVLDKRTASITNDQPQRSVYFRAGSSVDLFFSGVLKADGRKVSMQLSTENTLFPQVFQAADHAKVILALPDPQSAVAVDIAKVEMEEATIEGSIPLSWLALPTSAVQHTYDKQGLLTGTDLSFTAGYPGMVWKAEIADASGNVYRTVEGTGPLTSLHTDNAGGWVYLPAGAYTATYYLNLDGGFRQMGARPLIVPEPNVHVTAEAYTSYDLYTRGDVDGANACDAYTVYAPVVTHNVHPSLWEDSRYAPSLQVTLGDNPITGTTDGTTVTFDPQGGQTPSFTPCTLTATLTIGGSTFVGNRELYITGLPVAFAPPTSDNWSGSGTVAWENGEVRLGRNTTSQPQSITCNKFAVPFGTKVEASYNVMLHGAMVATTLTLSFGNEEYFKETSSSGLFNSKDHPFNSMSTFVTTSMVTEAKANNSYGSGQTCSYIYSLTYRYAE